MSNLFTTEYQTTEGRSAAGAPAVKYKKNCSKCAIITRFLVILQAQNNYSEIKIIESILGYN
jgi:hypothetical protein